MTMIDSTVCAGILLGTALSVLTPLMAADASTFNTARRADHGNSWQSITVHAGDTLSGILARRGMKHDTWHRLLALRGATNALNDLHPGDVIRLKKRSSGELIALRYRLDKLRTLSIRRKNGRFNAQILRLHVRTKRMIAVGEVAYSLTKSLAAEGVPTRIANHLATIYRPRFDLDRRIQPGDRFSVIYKVFVRHHKRVATGPIIAARIMTHGHAFSAFRSVQPDAAPAYYDVSGQPFQPGISRHPVDYTRISSPFSLRRMDPAVHFVHPHYGVDMAAPLGTPVRAAGRGTVKFVGRARGYGKLVELRHFDGYTTRYAHLHRFAAGLRKAEHVHRGQRIGTVGNTGWSTGPHLLFEIRKNGTPHDPMTMALPAGQALTGEALSHFKTRILPLVATLDDPFFAAGTPGSWMASRECNPWALFDSSFELNASTTAQRQGLKALLCHASRPETASTRPPERITARPDSRPIAD